MTNPAPPPWRVQPFASLASTQDAAIEAARSGDPGRLAILADIQTNGRGSRGRCWAAPPGNLNLSLLLCPEKLDPGRWALVAGIALHDALAPYAQTLMLKWPNDLLLNGAKLGGILIDASLAPGGAPLWLVIGLGANLANAPEIPGRRTARLAPPAPKAADVARPILATLDRYREEPTATIAADWLDRAHPIGTELDVQTGAGRYQGAFGGLTPRGELILAGQAWPIASAEVFLQESKQSFFDKKDQKTCASSLVQQPLSVQERSDAAAA